MARKKNFVKRNKKIKTKKNVKRKKKITRKYTKKRKYKKNIKRGGAKFIPNNTEELINKLNEFNIDISTWNIENGNKSVQQLFDEIKSGDSVINIDNNNIYRSVKVANAVVLSDDKQYRLIEKAHLNKDKQIVKERGNNVLSEKMDEDETVREAIIRGVQEELGEKYSRNIVFLNKNIPASIKNVEKSSYSYPGLKSMYTFYEKSIKIPQLTADFPPPHEIITEEKKSNGDFKRYIVWEWVENL